MKRREFIRGVAVGTAVALIPIAAFARGGTVVWGTKTITPSSVGSSLDQLRARKIIVHIKKELQNILAQYIFEPNDDITRRSISGNINMFMKSLADRGDVYDFCVMCDESNNFKNPVQTYTDVYVRPLNALETVRLTFVVTPSWYAPAGFDRGERHYET